MGSDHRPKYIRLMIQKQEQRKKQRQKEQLELQMYGKLKKKKNLVTSFMPVGKHRNFGSRKFQEYLDKGDYKEPSLLQAELLRGESTYKVPFKLLFKRLRCDDNKNKEFGDCYTPEY
jgi:hypothetical protein